jgi:hypothetical protein
MAHFAEIDAINTVVRVLVVPDDQEHRGHDYLADDMSLGGAWIQTSYRTSSGQHPEGTPLRGNYATIGCFYDPTRDAFYVPQPYPSWALDETTFQWEPPTPNTNAGYIWDEGTTSWVTPPSPFPSWVWDADGGRWEAPSPYPGDENGPLYEWDEATTSWVEVE